MGILPNIGVRPTVGLVLGAMALGAAVGNGYAREHHQLPQSVAQLDAAVIASADALSCLQGVQDDLYIDAVGTYDAASTGEARTRLDGCAIADAVSAAGRVSVPAAPPLDSAAWHRVHDDVATGQVAVHRGALDIRSAAAAMYSDLADHRAGSAVVLAYRAAYADYVQAGQVEADAAARLRELGVGVGVG